MREPKSNHQIEQLFHLLHIQEKELFQIQLLLHKQYQIHQEQHHLHQLQLKQQEEKTEQFQQKLLEKLQEHNA